MTENILSIDRRSVNENALFVKGVQSNFIALDGKQNADNKHFCPCVSVSSPLVERQNKKIYFKRSLKNYENSSYLCKILLR